MSKDELTRRVAATLDRGLADLDPGIERGLARARATALERAERAGAWRRWLIPAGSLAVVAAAVVLTLTLVRGPAGGPQTPAVPGPVAQAPAAEAPQPRILTQAEAPQAPAQEPPAAGVQPSTQGSALLARNARPAAEPPSRETVQGRTPPGAGGPWTRQQATADNTGTPAATADSTGTPAATAAMTADGDLDILAGSENLDLYEDLDFFAWLAEDANGQS